MTRNLPDFSVSQRSIRSKSLLFICSFLILSAFILICEIYLRWIAAGRDPILELSPLYWELPVIVIWILLFPFVYYVVKRNSLDGSRPWWHIFATHLFFGLFFSAIHIVLNLLLSGMIYKAAGMPFQEMNQWGLWSISLRLSWRLLFYALMVTTCYAVEFYYAVQSNRLENSELGSRLESTRLKQLKVKINPTFVHKTLAAVCSLIETNPTSAFETIARLGNFFRLILKQDDTLGHQVQILESYFRVETARTEKSVRTRIKIDKSLLKLRIHGLLLQPLIEKFYTTRTRDIKTRYRLKIRVRKSANGVELILKDNLRLGENTNLLFIEMNKSSEFANLRLTANAIKIALNTSMTHGIRAESIKPESSFFNLRLWLSLSLFAPLYYLTKNVLNLLAAGYKFNISEFSYFNIGVLLIGFSIPWILWLARKIRLRSLKSVCFHSALSVLCAFVLNCLESTLKAPHPFDFSWTQIFIDNARFLSFPDQVMMYWGVLLLANAFWNYRDVRNERIQTAHLQSDLSNAQIKALEMQLHPHFLFNTLHAINGLILTNKSVAASMISRLQVFLQLTLQSSQEHLIPFIQELNSLKCYLDIQQIRFANRLTINMDIDHEILGMLVPKLILQPILENAIRHGMQQKSSGGEILLRAKKENGILRIAVQDNGPGLTDNGRRRKGLGLKNSAQRLYHLYGNSQSFTYGNRLEGGFEVKMEIPMSA
jgi:LytS/YehU family sensor histidine kinase